MGGVIRLSEEAKENIRKAREERDKRTLDDVIKDIRRERKERQKLVFRRMMSKSEAKAPGNRGSRGFNNSVFCRQ